MYICGNIESMASLVSVNKAQCRIGSRTLLIVDSFDIEQGQHWCIFGRNGSGKTLLANLITGKRLESGSYVSYGADFDPARDLHIVSFEEQQRLWEQDNRWDISEFSGDAQDRGTLVGELIRASRSTACHDEALYAELTDGLGLQPLLEKGIRFLSSGQIRKVLIARALYAYRAGLPQLLILDDPLESIDRDSQEQIRRVIENHRQDHIGSLQLCRRSQDILPGASHMALMQRSGKHLRISQKGRMEEILASEDFSSLSGTQIQVDSRIGDLLTKNTEPNKEDDELIRLDDVQASYGDLEVLSDINWRVAAGDHVLIEGPNGCGKSTLLSLIDGENHKGYGQQVYLFGRLKGSGETIWQTKKNFGLVSNELHNKYIKGWRVRDVVVSGFFDSVGLYDERGSAETEAASNWLSVLGLEQLAMEYYHEISFGQQRLVLLARAMVKNPRILILDEPCVGLDDYHRQLILDVLDIIAAKSQISILYVTHVADEQPSCINKLLRFMSVEGRGFTVEQSALE